MYNRIQNMLEAFARRIFWILFGLALPVGIVLMIRYGMVTGMLLMWAIPVAGMFISLVLYLLSLCVPSDE